MMQLLIFKIIWLFVYADVAAYCLQTAIGPMATDQDHFESLLHAVYMVEAAIHYERQFISLFNKSAEELNISPKPIPHALLKNAGLAHLHLIRHASLKGVDQLPLLISSEQKAKGKKKGEFTDIFDVEQKLGWAGKQFTGSSTK